MLAGNRLKKRESRKRELERHGWWAGPGAARVALSGAGRGGAEAAPRRGRSGGREAPSRSAPSAARPARRSRHAGLPPRAHTPHTHIQRHARTPALRARHGTGSDPAPPDGCPPPHTTSQPRVPPAPPIPLPRSGGARRRHAPSRLWARGGRGPALGPRGKRGARMG